MVDLTSTNPWNPTHYGDDMKLNKSEYSELIDQVQLNRQQNITITSTIQEDMEKYKPNLLYPDEEVFNKTFQNTTRYGSINMRIPMRQHYKSRNPSFKEGDYMNHFPLILVFLPSQVTKDTTVHKFSLEINPHTLSTMECKVKGEVLRHYGTSLDNKEYLLP